MASGDLYRASIEWFEGALKYGETVLGYRQVGTEIGANGATDLGKAVELYVVPLLTSIISATFNTSSARVRGVSTPTEGVDVGYTQVNGARVTGDTYARTNGALISWKTGLIGRSFMGRTFVPPSMEGDWNSTGIIGSGYRTEVEGVANDLMVIVGTVDYTDFVLQIISEETGGAPRPAPIGTAVTSFIVRPYTGILRRRRG